MCHSLFFPSSLLTRYIERFRKAPPTPREGRRDHVGAKENFWWQQQQPPRGPLDSESDPSLPQNHSTPDWSNSTPDTTTSSESTGLQVWVLLQLNERETLLFQCFKLDKGLDLCPHTLLCSLFNGCMASVGIRMHMYTHTLGTMQPLISQELPAI